MKERRRTHEMQARAGDEVAREAARRLTRGESANLEDATRRAAESVNGGSGRAPSAKRIRQHAQAIDMQAIGEEAYRAQVRRWLELAEDLMTTIEQALPGSETLLVGRAADAHFDGDPAIHIRVYSPDDDIGAIARAIAAFGYDAQDAKFPAVDCRFGKLSQMQWVEEGGVRVTLLRCPRREEFDDRFDLVTGKPVTRIDATALRARVGVGREG